MPTGTAFVFTYIMLWIVFFICVSSADKLTIYSNARFTPIDVHFLVTIKSSINSQTECACCCYNNTMCLTATYSGVDQNCTLFSARLDQGQLQLMVTSLMTSVISFRNKTLPGMSILLHFCLQKRYKTCVHLS